MPFIQVDRLIQFYSQHGHVFILYSLGNRNIDQSRHRAPGDLAYDFMYKVLSRTDYSNLLDRIPQAFYYHLPCYLPRQE